MIYVGKKSNGGLAFKLMVEEMFFVAGAFLIGDFIPSLFRLESQGVFNYSFSLFRGITMR
jgi:hypothetical protein